MSGIDLESSSPSPEPETPAAAPAASVEAAVPAPVAAAPEDPDDQAAVELQGGKYVPLEALRAARSEAKGLKDRASQAESLAAENQQMRAYLQGLVAQQQQPRHPEPQAPPPEADPDLVELARSLDYYDKDMRPDVARAAKHAEIIEKRAAKMAQQIVGPVRAEATQRKAMANFQQALTIQGKHGHKANPQQLAQWFNVIGIDNAADERIPYVLAALQIGDDMLNGRNPLGPSPAPPANPPLVTEASGGSLRRVQPLSDQERKVLENRGMDEKKYHDYTKDWKPGRSTVLED